MGDLAEALTRANRVIDRQASEIEKLRAENIGLKSDYLRRHRMACERWLALRTIADLPIPEQDNMIAANMRKVALDAIAAADGE
jgi:hypothetical protein